MMFREIFSDVACRVCSTNNFCADNINTFPVYDHFFPTREFFVIEEEYYRVLDAAFALFGDDPRITMCRPQLYFYTNQR